MNPGDFWNPIPMVNFRFPYEPAEAARRWNVPACDHEHMQFAGQVMILRDRSFEEPLISKAFYPDRAPDS